MRILPPLFVFPFLAACATGLVERDELPQGARLLDTMQRQCATTVYVEDAVSIEAGESAVIELGDDRLLDWECLADPAADKHGIECPAGTDYLRVRREPGRAAAFTVECHG